MASEGSQMSSCAGRVNVGVISPELTSRPQAERHKAHPLPSCLSWQILLQISRSIVVNIGGEQSHCLCYQNITKPLLVKPTVNFRPYENIHSGRVC